jgi:hypothetical protein
MRDMGCDGLGIGNTRQPVVVAGFSLIPSPVQMPVLMVNERSGIAPKRERIGREARLKDPQVGALIVGYFVNRFCPGQHGVNSKSA